ncbi:hypothetical protein FB550_111247 [Neobacillus bataviensis]|uniref:Uncharacterized protein n=1 Tax=Neobacillus bataviensis TaxID=220685 RepID=A0A561D050_9BACI|nr:hypothetical protein [Neobacillus bataviensis]TWD96587.1 hypothetical protein FB550_111247 [Neobacillus bataviensis]
MLKYEMAKQIQSFPDEVLVKLYELYKFNAKHSTISIINSYKKTDLIRILSVCNKLNTQKSINNKQSINKYYSIENEHFDMTKHENVSQLQSFYDQLSDVFEEAYQKFDKNTKSGKKVSNITKIGSKNKVGEDIKISKNTNVSNDTKLNNANQHFDFIDTKMVKREGFNGYVFVTTYEGDSSFENIFEDTSHLIGLGYIGCRWKIIINGVMSDANLSGSTLWRMMSDYTNKNGWVMVRHEDLEVLM